jgi:hypothetical protein
MLADSARPVARRSGLVGMRCLPGARPIVPKLKYSSLLRHTFPAVPISKLGTDDTTRKRTTLQVAGNLSRADRDQAARARQSDSELAHGGSQRLALSWTAWSSGSTMGRVRRQPGPKPTHRHCTLVVRALASQNELEPRRVDTGTDSEAAWQPGCLRQFQCRLGEQVAWSKSEVGTELDSTGARTDQLQIP